MVNVLIKDCLIFLHPRSCPQVDGVVEELSIQEQFIFFLFLEKIIFDNWVVVGVFCPQKKPFLQPDSFLQAKICSHYHLPLFTLLLPFAGFFLSLPVVL